MRLYVRLRASVHVVILVITTVMIGICDNVNVLFSSVQRHLRDKLLTYFQV